MKIFLVIFGLLTASLSLRAEISCNGDEGKFTIAAAEGDNLYSISGDSFQAKELSYKGSNHTYHFFNQEQNVEIVIRERLSGTHGEIISESEGILIENLECCREKGKRGTPIFSPYCEEN